MVRRTKEEALETRASILDAAERVFFEKGVSRTSLADIAQAAGVTRGAIYWHFANKGDLFNEMFDRVLLPLDELKAASVNPEEADPLGRLIEICTVCLRDTAADPRRRRVFDILFLKCEFVEEMGPVMARYQTNMREGLGKIEVGSAQRDLQRTDARRSEHEAGGHHAARVRRRFAARHAVSARGHRFRAARAADGRSACSTRCGSVPRCARVKRVGAQAVSLPGQTAR